VLRAAAVAPDVVIGSVADPRENAPVASYDPVPAALVLTDGPHEIHVYRTDGSSRVPPPPRAGRVVSDYGAGDSFAGALTYFIARGMKVEDACAAAGAHGAAVLGGLDPIASQRPLSRAHT
jgi:ribokinase